MPRFERFVDTVYETAEEYEGTPTLLDALRDPFGDPLDADDWLPERYRTLESNEDENMSDMGVTSRSGCCTARGGNCRCRASSSRRG